MNVTKQQHWSHAMFSNIAQLAVVNILLSVVYSVYAAPLASTASIASAAPPVSATVTPATDDPNEILWISTSDIIPEPMRGTLGSNILGPQNVPLDLQNADMLAPPTTDAGTV